MSSSHDFDFLHGRWKVEHSRLRERLNDCLDWDASTGTAECRPVLCGIGNVDRFTFDGLAHEGMTLRLFDLTTRMWTIHWADSRTGRLDPPLAGRFESGLGLFFGRDDHNGRPVRVRFTWHTAPRPRWEQAFSIDEGRTWETNWIMDFTKL